MWNDTIVVFISDHGYHTGHNGRWHKGWLFEQTTLTPMIIAAPGKSPGHCEQVVELLDIYPTLVELCHQRVPAALEGRSLVSLLNDPKHASDNRALTTVRRVASNDKRSYVGHSVRTSDYRYTEWDEGRLGTEFYVLADDPPGLRNLAHEPTYAHAVADMRRLLHKMCGTAAE